jgi:hypothetical protein
MRRAHDRSSGSQEDQAAQSQQVGATGTGPGTTAGAAATGGADQGPTGGTETYRTTTTRTYEGGTQPAGPYGRTEPAPGPGGGYSPNVMETGASTWHGGLFLLLAGLLTWLAGLGFVVRNAFFHAHGLYAFNWSIDAWGWVLLGVGIVTFAVGASHLLGLPWSRPAGIVMAILTAVAGFMIIAFYPLWGIIIVGLGLAALWGLAHGAQSRERERRAYEYERQRQMRM